MSIDHFPVGLELDVSYPEFQVGLTRRVVRMLAEHRDVLQNEVPLTDALGGIAMFDPEEGVRHHD